MEFLPTISQHPGRNERWQDAAPVTRDEIYDGTEKSAFPTANQLTARFSEQDPAHEQLVAGGADARRST